MQALVDKSKMIGGASNKDTVNQLKLSRVITLHNNLSEKAIYYLHYFTNEVNSDIGAIF